jgi:hypothetical protein
MAAGINMESAWNAEVTCWSEEQRPKKSPYPLVP